MYLELVEQTFKMGRVRRSCPVFVCGSTNLVRLANHLDQVHGMDRQEAMERGKKKWKENLMFIYKPLN